MFKKVVVISALATYALSFVASESPKTPTIAPLSPSMARLLSPEIHFSGPGCLDIIGGPMASGKSLALMRVISVLEVAGIKTLVCKHSLDTRARGLKSRMGIEAEGYSIDDPNEILELAQAENYGAFAIDEAQFFPQRTFLPVISQLLHDNKYVVVAGLLKDFRNEWFGHSAAEPLCMETLRAMASDVVELCAVCMHCKQLPPNATMTQRLVDGKPAHRSDPLVMIDDGSHRKVTYEARCVHCWELPE